MSNQAEIFFEAIRSPGASIKGFNLTLNSSLGMEAFRICLNNDSVQEGEKEEVRAHAWIREAGKSIKGSNLKSLSDVSIQTEELSKVAKAFTTKLAKGIENLKQVRSEVEGLVRKIEEVKEKNIATNPLTSKLAKNVDFNYEVFPFAKLEVCGNERSLINYICSVAEVNNTYFNERATFIVIRDRFPAREFKKYETTDVSLSKEVMDKAVAQVVKDTSLDEATVRNVILTLTSKDELTNLGGSIVTYTKDEYTTAACLKLISIVDNYRRISASLDNVLTGLNEKPDSLSANLMFTDVITDFAAASVVFHKNTTFKNTVLMNNNTLNPSVKAQADKEGYTNKDIALYVKQVLDGKNDRETGVTLPSLQLTKDSVTTLTVEEEAKNKGYIENIKRDAYQQAFIEVMGDWLAVPVNSVKANLVTTPRSFAASRSEFILTKQGSLEDSLYSFVLDLTHRGSFEGMIHGRLESAYVKAIAMGVEHTAETIGLINASVYAEITTEFIVSNFCTYEK